MEGATQLERITLQDLSTGALVTEDADYVFAFIGASPRTGWLDGVLLRDDKGFVLSGPDLGPKDGIPGWDLPREPLLLETSVPGVFAAGDVRAHSVKRLASGVGEGAMAAALIQRYRAGS